MVSALLIQGSASHLPLADESVQCVVTSPPYWGLRQYAGEQGVTWADGTSHPLGLEPTPDLFITHMVEVFREVRRVLRKDGTVWLNIGDSYVASRSGPIGDFSTLDGGQSSQKASRQAVVDARPSHLRPHSRWHFEPWGLKPKDLVLIPQRVAIALQADGWYVRAEVIWHKPNPMPESVNDRPTKAHEQVWLLTKSGRYYYDADAIKEPASWNTHARKARVRDDHKSNPTAERNGIRAAGVGPKASAAGSGVRYNESFSAAVTDAVEDRNKRTVWSIPTRPYPGAHFATYPEQLVEPCILAGSKAGDVVLDPFNGSGTTGRVAVRHGRSYVGLDISAEYLHEQATKRIDNVQHVMGGL